MESDRGRDEPLTPDALFERTLAFCRLLRDADFGVTHSRVADAIRSLRAVDLGREEEVRLALRGNLASSWEEERSFDRLFDRFFRGTIFEDAPHPIALQPEPVRGRLEEGWKESHRDVLADPNAFSPDEIVRDLDLTRRWDDDAPALESIVRELARRIATRESRRRAPANRGDRVDLRRSLRRNAHRGLDVVELCRTTRRIHKTRLVMLCDVSGSMDAYNPFLLRLLFSLQKELVNSRTVVFSTQVTEITHILRRRSVPETLREVSRSVRHWSGGTDIGAALGSLNRDVLRQGSARSTVAIVISDGYDQGRVSDVEREMRALRRRVRTVVWINPMYGSASYAPTASGMRAALPYVDHFLPAWDAASLRVLVRGLATL